MSVPECDDDLDVPEGPDFRLARITLFPLKSFDGVDVPTAAVLPTGNLAWDRRFALFDLAGNVVDGKREPRVHAVAARWDLEGERVTLGPRRADGSPGEGSRTFRVDTERRELEAALSRLLAVRVTVEEDAKTGFPDDAESPGPTVISTATLAAVGDWFDLPLGESRRRFRANLEFSAQGTGHAEPFAEDRLVPPAGQEVEFWVGEGRFVGTNPCQRCAVPARDSFTGAKGKGFEKEFARLRRKHLPAFAPAERFDHFYRLGVNTGPLGRGRGGGTGGVIHVGDAVRVIGPRPQESPGTAGATGRRSRRR